MRRHLRSHREDMKSLDLVCRAQIRRIVASLQRSTDRIYAGRPLSTVVTIRGNVYSTIPTARAYQISEVTHDDSDDRSA